MTWQNMGHGVDYHAWNIIIAKFVSGRWFVMNCYWNVILVNLIDLFIAFFWTNCEIYNLITIYDVLLAGLTCWMWVNC